MKQFVFNGPEVYLGRFGTVGPGSVLLLTDHEASCIATDKRFTAYNSTKHTDATAVGPRTEQAIDALERQEIRELPVKKLRAMAKDLGIRFDGQTPQAVLAVAVENAIESERAEVNAAVSAQSAPLLEG